jgi:hypothetical protein
MKLQLRWLFAASAGVKRGVLACKKHDLVLHWVTFS